MLGRVKALIPQAVYEVELCSGEHRRWQYLGLEAGREPVWRDLETGRAFRESSLMYAWTLLGEAPGDPPPPS